MTRKEITENIIKLMPCTCIPAYKLRDVPAPNCASCNYADEIADWHMAEVKRIVEPLLDIKKKWDLLRLLAPRYSEAIDETLKRAGVE